MASLDDLHDRLTKAQDVLVDLRHMINRLAGNANSLDSHRRSSSTSSFSDAFNLATISTSLPPSGDDLFFYLDKEAADDLINDITDTLREAQDDFDLLREDAVDLGVIAAEPSISITAVDGADEPAETHAVSNVNRTLRPFGASLRSSSAHSGHSGLSGHSGMSSSFTEEDSSSTADSHRLKRGVTRLGESLADARKAFRAAQLAAHRNREAAQREQHRQVLASYIEEEESESEHSDGEDTTTGNDNARQGRPHSRTRVSLPTKHTSPTTSAAADVTAALRQTHARIAGEVARSDFAAQTLAESSKALAELGDKYGGGGSTGAGGGGDIGTSLKSARTLVKGLVAAHKSDTWYLQTALYMVVVTIGWLLFRRLLYGPLWLLVWWPVRTMFGTAAWMGRTGSSVAAGRQSAISVSEAPMASVVTSVVTTSVPAEVYATEEARAAPSDSLVEEVGRIVDGTSVTSEAAAAATGEAGSASEQADQPNPKKRMWEEDVEAAKYEAQLQKEREEKERAEAEKAEQDKGKGKEPAEGDRKKDEL